MLYMIRKIGYVSLTAVCLFIATGFGFMNKSNLTSKELEILLDKASFNKLYGEKGWGLKSRQIENEDLSGIELRGGVFEDVDFLAVKFIGVKFYNVTFRRVKFTEGIIKSSSMDGVKFEKCEFSIAKIEDVNCTNCVFVDTVFDEVEAKNVLFDSVKFLRIEDRDSSYLNMSYVNSEFVESGIHSGFILGKMHNVKFVDSKLTDTGFGGVDIKNVLVKGGEFHTGFTGSDGGVDGLVFEEVDINVVSFADNVKGREIRFRSLKRLGDLDIISKANIDGMIIEDSKTITGPAVLDATLKNFTIKNSTANYFIITNDARLEGGIVFENTKINAMRIENSKVAGLEIKGGVISDFLIVKNSEFKQMRLVDVEIEKGTEIDVKSNKYIESDIFPDH